MINLINKIKNLPDSPGVYFFYDNKNILIYVGKASSLRNRVRSYWSSIQKSARPIEEMIHEVKNIKCVKTDSILESAILEGKYIKDFQPKYNIKWRDDKSWNYIAITKDIYPKIKIIREREMEFLNIKTSCPDLASGLQHFFGPYPGLNIREVLKILRKLFFISTCDPKQKRPCLYYEMKQCLGVCVGEISPFDYKNKVIKPLIMFLRGEKKKLIKSLTKKMIEFSKEENFEEAGRLRNQIKALQRIQDIALLNKDFVENVQKLSIKNHKSKIFRIEAYDISNFGKSFKVGSLVVFDEKYPIKSEYKKFKIKTVSGQSDVDCLSEVLRRRFAHTDWPLPKIIFVDGGKPQLNTAKKILDEFKINLPVVGIAKGPKRKRNDFYIANCANIQKESFIKWVNENKNLLIMVRDEAHRFAINYHRKLNRHKDIKTSCPDLASGLNS